MLLFVFESSVTDFQDKLGGSFISLPLHQTRPLSHQELKAAIV